jgi:hypothetical protein
MEQQAEYRKLSAEAGRFICPHQPGSVYWGVIETLSQLGENQEHSFGDFYSKLQEVMSDEKLKNRDGKTPWEIFSGREARSGVSAKNIIDKIHQNIRVLQRLGGANPYGMKLAQLNCCIDVLGTTQTLRLKLRTGIPNGEAVHPIREIRKREFNPATTVPAGYCVAEPVGEGKSVAVAVEEATAASSTGSNARSKPDANQSEVQADQLEEVGSGKD